MKIKLKLKRDSSLPNHLLEFDCTNIKTVKSYREENKKYIFENVSSKTFEEDIKPIADMLVYSRQQKNKKKNFLLNVDFKYVSEINVDEPQKESWFNIF